MPVLLITEHCGTDVSNSQAYTVTSTTILMHILHSTCIFRAISKDAKTHERPKQKIAMK